MQVTALRQALNGGDLVTLVPGRQGQARIDRVAVDVHGAGAALTVVAAFFGTGQIQAVTQYVQQTLRWLAGSVYERCH